VTKIPLNININRDDQNQNDYLFIWQKIQSRPSRIALYNTYSTEEFLQVINLDGQEKNIFTEIIPNTDDYLINERALIKISETIYISYVCIDKTSENSIIDEVVFFYKDENDISIIDDVINKLNTSIVDFSEEEGNKVNTIQLNQNSLDLESIDLSEMDEDIELYYNSATFKKLNSTIKKIKKSNKGLSIFYGERGTGKTTIINYLSSKIDKIILFIPSNMIEHTINNPDFRKFLNKLPKSLIIIDDCELILNQFYNRSNITTNNLLQLVDGVLSDMIGTNIIAIFNVDDPNEIDFNLRDCNSLIDEVQFVKLNNNESSELSKKIGHNKKYKTDQRLIDVLKNNKINTQTELGL
jgi:hypothetical protein